MSAERPNNPESPPKEIDFLKVHQWIRSLEEKTKHIVIGSVYDGEIVHESTLGEVKGNFLAGYTKEDEKNYWDRNSAEPSQCSCKEWFKLPGCSENSVITFKDGITLPAIPYGQESMEGFSEDIKEEIRKEYAKEGHRCHDCACFVGQFHHPGCDMESCPRCGGQAISCDCLTGYINEEAEKKDIRRTYLEDLLGARDDFYGIPDTVEGIKKIIEDQANGYHYLRDDIGLKNIPIEEYLELVGYFEWLDSQGN